MPENEKTSPLSNIQLVTPVYVTFFVSVMLILKLILTSKKQLLPKDDKLPCAQSCTDAPKIHFQVAQIQIYNMATLNNPVG